MFMASCTPVALLREGFEDILPPAGHPASGPAIRPVAWSGGDPGREACTGSAQAADTVGRDQQLPTLKVPSQLLTLEISSTHSVIPVTLQKAETASELQVADIEQ